MTSIYGKLWNADRCSDIKNRRRIRNNREKSARPVKKRKNNVEIACTDENFFVKYFDLCKNYDIIRLKLGDKGLFRAAIDFGQGIRILQQDPFETLISFIISANNHIPRIKSIIERLSTALGDRCDGFNAFPTAKALSGKDADYYFKAGLGYRAPYIVETARAVKDGFDLDGLQTLSTDKARKELMTLKGVGPKVADCILLFGFGREDVFPVDTWIKRFTIPTSGTRTIPQKSERL